jgi:hypothetical protein
MTLRDYVDKEYWNHSFVLYRAKGYIEHSVSDFYKINGAPISAWDDDVQARLLVVVEFIKSAVEILEKEGVPKHIRLRDREEHSVRRTFYDHLANMIFEVISAASMVRDTKS